MAKYSYTYEQYKEIHKQVNEKAGCTNCYDYNFVQKVLDKFVEFANAGKIRVGYSSGLTNDDGHYIALYGFNDGTNTMRGRIQAVISVFDKVSNPSVISQVVDAVKNVVTPKTTTTKTTTTNTTTTATPEQESPVTEQSGGIGEIVSNYWWVLLLGGGALWYFNKK